MRQGRTAAGSFVWFSLALLLLTACSTPEPISVGEGQSGDLLELTAGQQVVVRLYANRPKGYHWVQLHPEKSCLRSEGKSKFEPAAEASGGWETWRFTAGPRGVSTLRFEYWAPDEAEPRQEVHYRIIVDWPRLLDPPSWKDGNAVLSGSS